MKINFDKAYEEACGFGAPFRYHQDGKYYHVKGHRVNPATGDAWSDRDEEKVQDIKQLEEAGKEEKNLATAAKAAKQGVELPTRILSKGKK